MLRYGLPLWVLGVVLSFALPAVPHWPAVIVLWLGLLAAAWRFRPLWLLCALLAGMGYGVWRTQAALAAQWPLQVVGSAVLRLTVADLPQRDERRVRFRADAVDGEGRRYRLQLADYQLREWPVGSRWQVQARVRPPIGEVNGAGFNREAWALANGIGGIGTVGKVREAMPPPPQARGDRAEILMWLPLWREQISRRWQAPDGQDMALSDGLGLMRALSIGEQSALSAAAWQAFRPLGVNHLVSISGLHVGMVALMAGWLVGRGLRFLPFTPSRPRTLMLVAGVTAGLLYAGLAGFSVPTQRSVLMLLALAWAWWRGSGASVWRGWWQALALVLLIDPASVLAAGFWLSFGLVAALLWVSSGRYREAGRGWHLAAQGQWAVTVLSVVLLGSVFASVPLISPLVNAVAIPWFSWVLVPLALLASLLPWPPLQWLAAAAGEYTLRLLIWLAAQAPEYAVAAAPWPLVCLAVLAAGVLLLPRGLGLKPLACLVLAGFVWYRPPPVGEGRLKAVVWDVGQGLSVLLQTRQHRLLFDTGTEAAAGMAVLPGLNAAGVRGLDALVLSHQDADHDGGFAAVKQAKKPRRLWAGQPAFYAGAQDCAEQSWQWDGVQFEFLRVSARPDGKGDAPDSMHDNDQSCVLRVVAGNQALLVGGDLGRAGERALVAQYGEALYSQVLLLGHHGSNSSSDGSFLNAVAPQYAVASSGYGNAYNHPAPAVQSRVRAHGIRLLRTDRQGALYFELGGDEVLQGRLKTDKPYWQKKPFAD
ncbi:DNA internalization-related competence protein ComEC/Rec2 [Uruburuella testudinis]|uniref:DNA internalization-related competence protein ComEC/Rec2 n=1 Tax=Uruburuella testudinis TaxID=1282863 RepID=A0ABY4DQM4_9NEIS|nr:DNA internalization-related competence protein ComEC/Rec2 [Uruburuella testudinis]UOO81248.1 DNA internalization-related competence protein ComEC/Rec2 [Uruburuella testudinis]